MFFILRINNNSTLLLVILLVALLLLANVTDGSGELFEFTYIVHEKRIEDATIL